MAAMGCAPAHGGPSEPASQVIVPPLGTAAGTAATPATRLTATGSQSTLQFPLRDSRQQKPVRERAEVQADITRLQAAVRLADARDLETAAVMHKLADTFAEHARLIERQQGGYDVASRDFARNEAIRLYWKIEVAFPKYEKAHEIMYYRALEFEFMGRYGLALEVYGLVTRNALSTPFVALAHFGLGECTMKSGRADVAAPHYERAMGAQGSPIVAESLFRLAQLARMRGDVAGAEAALARIRREFPDSDAARMLPRPD
jgi:TolA-binding protein